MPRSSTQFFRTPLSSTAFACRSMHFLPTKRSQMMVAPSVRTEELTEGFKVPTKATAPVMMIHTATNNRAACIVSDSFIVAPNFATLLQSLACLERNDNKLSLRRLGSGQRSRPAIRRAALVQPSRSARRWTASYACRLVPEHPPWIVAIASRQ